MFEPVLGTPELMDAPFDPGRQHSLPWQSGLTGIGYDASKVKEIRSVEDLWRPDLKGRVVGLSATPAVGDRVRGVVVDSDGVDLVVRAGTDGVVGMDGVVGRNGAEGVVAGGAA